jgi:hypothetical protein
MKHRKLFYTGWLLALAVLLAGAIIIPARGTNKAHAVGADLSRPNSRNASAMPVNATFYLSLSMLESLFQQNIAQQAPASFNNAIDNALNGLPSQDRGWVQQMIAALLQPGAALTGLSTQQNGLAMSLRITLYPGDPEPINSSMLITFRVLNASTVQVSAQSLNGGPTLANGPIATFQIPIGQLSGINTTPTCGSSALAVHLQIPIALSHTQPSALVGADLSRPSLSSRPSPLSQPVTSHPSSQSPMSLFAQESPKNLPASANAFVEIPASSLAQLGSSIGTMPVSSGLTAQNIQVGVQSGQLVITSDVYSSIFGQIGTATTTMAPGASGGSLTVTVTNTTFTLFGFIPIPENSYNQQIQQTLNSKLSSAFTGKFAVTQAQIGPNGSIPCAAADSLVLSGSTSLG